MGCSAAASASDITDITETTDTTETTSNNNNRDDEDQAFEFNVNDTLLDILRASKFNQGQTNSKWDASFSRQAVLRYQNHLQYILHNQQQQNDDATTTTATDVEHKLTSPDTVSSAFRALLRCNYETTVLANRVRQLEQCVGQLALTPLTNELSLILLKANGLAGNVGRTLALLNLRKTRNYPPQLPHEFDWAIQSIVSAGLELRRHRNIYKGDTINSNNYSSLTSSSSFAALDNPTRFLDTILINMHHRNVPLTPDMATRLLQCYSVTGRTGKATHFHYKLKRVDKNGYNEDETDTDDSNHQDAKNNRRRRRHLVRMQWNRPAPYYKIPSEISEHQLVSLPGKEHRQTKKAFEMEKTWSLPLTAAFEFLDSLLHGACGHDPLPSPLPVDAYNAMIKACCYRGALWRAMELLRSGTFQPNIQSYHLLLDALARVGDATTMQTLFFDELLVQMRNNNINNKPLLQCKLGPLILKSMVDGYLNTSNIAGAISFLQTIFNQYGVLPPYTTHLQVLEFALATTGDSSSCYEAKRHVYFIQQCWLLHLQQEEQDNKPTTSMTTSKFTKSQLGDLYRQPKLSKAALKRLFDYFGHDLMETDFLVQFRDL